MSTGHTWEVNIHPLPGIESVTCYPITSEATLTYALVVMKDPAGFAAEAFIVLWP